LTWAPEGKRKRRRPKTTWRRTVEREREEGGWKSWKEVRKDAVNRDRWKHNIDHMHHKDPKCEEDR